MNSFQDINPHGIIKSKYLPRNNTGKSKPGYFRFTIYDYEQSSTTRRNKKLLENLMKEANALAAIFTAAIKTSKTNQNRKL